MRKRPRPQVHQQSAQVIAARFPARVEMQPALVAQHYTAAGCTAPAVHYWPRAGQQASDRSAHVEAVRHCTTGIDLLKSLAETPEHTPQALSLPIALGAARQMPKGPGAPEVERADTRHVPCVSRSVRRQSCSRSCWVCGGMLWYGYSCIPHENSGTRCCAWRNMPTTPRSRSSPTLLWA